jgi:hypothetical protein
MRRRLGWLLPGLLVLGASTLDLPGEALRGGAGSLFDERPRGRRRRLRDG